MNFVSVFNTHGQWAVKSISAYLIYSKYVLSTIFFACLLLPAQPLSAQNLSAKADLQLVFDIQPDGSVRGEYKTLLTNNSDRLLNNLHLGLPALDISETTCKVNEQNCASEVDLQEIDSFLNLNFNVNPIRPGQTAQVHSTFLVRDLLKNKYGLKILAMPKLETGFETGQVKVLVKFPPDFGDPSYISTTDVQKDAGYTQLRADTGFLMVWGDKALIQVDEELNLAEGEQELVKFNLIPTLNQQYVVYNKFGTLYAAGEDKVHNIWGLFKKGESKPSYSSQVLIDATQEPKTVVAGSYIDIALPEELKSKINNVGSTYDKAREISSFISAYFQPTNNIGYTREQLDKLKSEVEGGRKELHFLEYAYLTASFLKQLGVENQIKYGYLSVDEFSGINSSTPHAWVEFMFEGKLVVVDPFVADLSGFNTFNSPSYFRIAFGIWDPINVSDSVLGVMAGGARSRPSLANVALPAPTTKDYHISANMSSRVMAGGFYEGEMEIENKSAEFIRIREISFGSRKVEGEDLTIAGDLRKVVMPLQSSKLQFVNLREPDYLLEGNVTKTLKFVPENDGFAIQEVTLSIRFISDQRVLVVILIVTAAVALVLLIVIARISINERRFKANIRKQMNEIHQDKLLSKPKLAQTADPKPVEKFSRVHKL